MMSDPIRVEDLDSDWSLFQCVAWIMFRDPTIVRDSSMDSPRAATIWESAPSAIDIHIHDRPPSPENHQREAVGTGIAQDRFPPIEAVERPSEVATSTQVMMGEAGYSDLRLDIEAAWRLDQGQDTPLVLSTEKAKAVLLARLRAAKISACFHGRRLVEISRGVLAAEPSKDAGGPNLIGLTIARTQMLAQWPPVDGGLGLNVSQGMVSGSRPDDVKTKAESTTGNQSIGSNPTTADGSAMPTQGPTGKKYAPAAIVEKILTSVEGPISREELKDRVAEQGYYISRRMAENAVKHAGKARPVGRQPIHSDSPEIRRS